MTDERNRTIDGEPINPPFGEGRWQDALRRARDRIEDGLELEFWDDETVGSKSTECSWGMCTTAEEQWPDADDQTWPESYRKHGRVAPRQFPLRAGCPLDRATGTKDESHLGCFYRCRVFQDGLRDRTGALNLYDDAIDLREVEHGRRETADDQEPWE